MRTVIGQLWGILCVSTAVGIAAADSSVAASPYEATGGGMEATAEADDESANTEEAKPCLLEDGKVLCEIGTGSVSLQLPGAALAVFEYGNSIYVALGSMGAAVFERSGAEAPRQILLLPATGGDITGFAMVDGAVWMRTVSTRLAPMPPMDAAELASVSPASTAVPVETASDPSPPSSTESQAERASAIRVLSVSGGTAVLSVGSADGVRVGERFSVLRSVSLKGADGTRQFKGTELAAVVEVTAVNEESCLVVIWRGDRVTTADQVVSRMPAHRNSLVFPRHLTDFSEVSVNLRPFLNVDGPVGVGAVTDISAVYRGRGYYAGVRLEPFAFAFVEDGSAMNLTVTAEAGFSARAFAIGLGLGFNNTTFKANAFSISQAVRLGAADGLNVTVRNIFSLRKHTDYNDLGEPEKILGFEWGGIVSRLTVPVTGRMALFSEGGGGEGYFLADMGVDAWLIGNGDRGSLCLSVGAGAAGLFADNGVDEIYDPQTGETEYRQVNAVGPMVTLGLTYRFGFMKN